MLYTKITFLQKKYYFKTFILGGCEAIFSQTNFICVSINAFFPQFSAQKHSFLTHKTNLTPVKKHRQDLQY